MNKRNLAVLVIVTIVAFAVVLSRVLLQTRAHPGERKAAVNLIVYAEASFIDVYGPAADLKKEFEKTCDCTVEYIDAGGATAAIERLKLDPTRRVDVVLGIDHLLLKQLGESVKLQQLTPDKWNWRPEVYHLFIRSFYLTTGHRWVFIYRRGEIAPAQSLKEALANLPKASLSLQDPTLSTSGLEFIYWLYALSSRNGEPAYAETLQTLKPVVHSYSPSWSGSYGLFKNGQAKVTFSYLSSLIYHWQEEKNENYQFMVFGEGHPAQLEYAVVPESCWNCAVAKKFVEFLLSPFAQTTLVKKNYMLPVVEGIEDTLGPVYKKLPKVKILPPDKLEPFAQGKERLLEQWRQNALGVMKCWMGSAG